MSACLSERQHHWLSEIGKLTDHPSGCRPGVPIRLVPQRIADDLYDRGLIVTEAASDVRYVISPDGRGVLLGDERGLVPADFNRERGAA